MDRFDVIIIGGGSAGLSALKHISTLGKQAILIESGKQIGSKNISGGILYSKNSLILDVLAVLEKHHKPLGAVLFTLLYFSWLPFSLGFSVIGEMLC